MTVDLAGPRITAEATLSATCTITRDTPGVADDTLDADTLELVPPDPDSATVYQGACTVRPVTARGPAEEGTIDVYRTEYRLLLPVTAEPAIGDTVTITASDDPNLTDRTLTIVDVAYSSRAVLRRCRAIDRRPGPRT